MENAPPIFQINNFLYGFITSSEERLQINPNDVTTPSHSLLTALQGLDYERVRLRVRIMSSLDPVVNTETETGMIEAGVSIKGVKHRARLRSTFELKAASILLQKLEIIPSDPPITSSRNLTPPAD